MKSENLENEEDSLEDEEEELRGGVWTVWRMRRKTPVDERVEFNG